MRILINTSILRFGGAVQGALSIINECRNFNEHEYFVFVGPGVNKSLKRDNFPSNFHFYDFDFGAISFLKIPRLARILNRFETEIKPDCVITTSGPSYWHTDTPHLMGYNLPLYIYPESPYINMMSIYRRFRWSLKRRIHFYFFRRDASACFVQTDDVNRRVRRALDSNKIFTVTNTHNGYYNYPIKKEDKLPPKGPGELRLLTLSSYYRHKNLEIIPEISDELIKRGHKNIRFILTIDEENYKRIFNDIYKETVINIGSVKPEECPSLYNECDIMFLPTLAECFSASYPEAMVMQKPIVTTDLGFAKNICDDAALYYRPMDPADAADKIELLINEGKLKKELIQNGLKRLKSFDSARERAGKILEICENLISEPDSKGK